MLLPFLRNRTPVPNRTPNGMKKPVMGLILHQQMGSESGTDSWFHNGTAQASSHFGAPKKRYTKTLLGDQWVDTVDKAWAQVAGNPDWWSLECEGNGEPLTPDQIEEAAQIMAAAHLHEGVPLQITDSPTVRGLGWHGMGGKAWGGHLECGKGFRAQRPAILKRAAEIVAAQSPRPAPKPAPKKAPAPAKKAPAKSAPKPVVYRYTRTLRLGCVGGDVCHMQRRLGLTPTGFYGLGTRQKVAIFQKVHHLTVDGIAGTETQKVLG